MHSPLSSSPATNQTPLDLAYSPPPPPNVMEASASPVTENPNLYQILQSLIANESSGKLIVHSEANPDVQWRIYLGNGRIHYAGSDQGQRERLNYLFQRYIPTKNIRLEEPIASDYQYLCELWDSQQFSFQEIRSILAKLTQEALVQILSLSQPVCVFEETVGLDRLLLYLDFKQLMQPATQEIKHWFKVRNAINSPFQRAIADNVDAILPGLCKLEHITSDLLNRYQKLPELVAQEMCVYEIAESLNTSILNVAIVLKTLVNQGIISMGPYEPQEEDNRPVIACVDDSPSIQRVVSFALEATGFKVINIKQAASALTTLMHAKPALILMDINMPDIDGYQLCSICNKSEALKHIPIVMLTGRSGVLDRVKAKMHGSVGYICKPFQPQELVETVQSFISVNPMKV
ncbi:response regulator [Synechocystis salina LEGE 06099]|uniref:response regulator n=1 Tax=Synechocystis salina TaxID=945780 RepID=UPI001881B64D|nr:response regulator [Synechocystis salina]MBE9204190.1 response regulator [Synechocystis salina LEGE 06099]